MQADQDAMCVDAPKPKHPHARPVGKTAKDLKTSDSTMDDRQAGAKIVADKPLVTKGRGRMGGAKKLAADASIENPASEDEDGELVQTKKKKKLAVREAIQAVLNAGIVIDSTKACDGEVQKTSDVQPHQLRVNPSTSSVQPRTSYSKLTKGSTISSNVPPPLTPISTSNAGGFTEFNMYVSDEDEDDEELAKPLSHITSNKAYTGIVIVPKALDGVVPSDVTCRGATEQPDPIEDADDIDSLDHDSDLEPPPLAQKPRSHSTPPMDFDSLASQKWKLSPPLDYDNIMELSSEAESVQGANEDVKTEPVDPVFTRRVTSTTNIAVTLKAPPAKRLKSESSTPSKPISVWNAVYKGKIPHMVEADGPVLAITLQRLSEWCNTFSNVALAMLANFMTSQDDLKTDEDLQRFCIGLTRKVQLFIWGHCRGWRGSRAAQMERAIRLFINGHMLLGDINTSGNGRGNKTPLDVNPSTGNQSSVPLAFSEANWGAHTRAYMASITCLSDSGPYPKLRACAEPCHEEAVAARGWMWTKNLGMSERSFSRVEMQFFFLVTSVKKCEKVYIV
ncbi:uncharacterized protein F5891DRAFT_977315 [Suillus fuscotomentosus]|uniref:Uncharacterized protein n=1 Tax=Suillus fuscotomentosus TaxID=1912939 RepID=A0AAD4ECH4_9AGAM|nr:uncharacterized protein F5891DRAFT_977315 [Suillus fuscotomentosus]KAG1903745.1 hypothetical protein F5891DRAFT_977315 [Suillus fuscotomentosus]